MAERVIGFVSKQVRINAAKLDLGTSLFHDLGIDGDDAVDFFKAFSDEFQTDLSELDLRKHFGAEGWTSSGFFLRLLSRLRITNNEELKPVPICLSDLVKAAEARKWIQPL